MKGFIILFSKDLSFLMWECLCAELSRKFNEIYHTKDYKIKPLMLPCGGIYFENWPGKSSGSHLSFRIEKFKDSIFRERWSKIHHHPEIQQFSWKIPTFLMDTETIIAEEGLICKLVPYDFNCNLRKEDIELFCAVASAYGIKFLKTV